jgi:NAD(P)-dependent dehydrogenase (short-subunit alcohol dehydrogenase family)
MGTQEYFSGKTCVVTGAASGIGYAVSQALLEYGACVCMTDRDTELLASAIAQLKPHAGRVESAPLDVTQHEQVRHAIQDVASRHGRLDVLFNNAGVGAAMPTAEATLEHWRRVIDLNLWGVIYGIHAALPIMRRQGSGHLVNTSSLAGLLPIPYQALYNTTKYAVVGLSESLRFELAPDNIHVSVVCPGAVVSRIWSTPVIGERFEAKPPADAIPAEEAAQIMLAGVAKQQGIIVLPESARGHWLTYCRTPEASEKLLMELARQRREAYQTKGTFY